MNRPDRYLATRAQQAFWTLATMRPGSSVGNEVVLLRLRGDLAPDRLAAALQQLEVRHDTWRTRYVSVNGSLFAEVCEPRGEILERIDLSQRKDPERSLRNEVRRRATASYAFDEPHFLRASLFRLGDDEHALLLCSHHIACDGTSLFAMLPAQLAAIYGKLSSSGSAPNPGGPTYQTLAATEQARREAEPAREHESFWRDQLQGAPLVLDLPVDSPRPAVREMTGTRIRKTVDATARAELERVAQEQSVHMYDLVLSALAVLLHRYTSQDEFLVGTVHANRRESEREHVYGCLIQTVPVRCNLAGNPSLAEVVRQVHRRRKEAFRHLDSIADELLARMAPPDPSRNPGYQVLFNYMPFSEQSASFPGLEVTASRPDPQWTATDLSFDVVDDGDELVCILDRDTALFEQKTAADLLEAWTTAIETLPKHLEQPLGQLPLVSGRARKRLLKTGAGGGRATPAGTLHGVVERRVVETPDSIAVVHDDTELTYAQLWGRAGALAHRIRPYLDQADSPYVALVLRDPIDHVVSMLATLRAGGAYIPVDPDLPAKRVKHMLEDAPAAVAVVGDGLRFEGAPRIPPVKQGEEPFTAPGIHDEDPCYVIFTSGSTGRPKGVVVRHQNVVHQLDAREACYGEPPERLLPAYSFAFDAAVAGMYWALGTGGTLVLLDHEARRDPWALRRWIERAEIRTLDIPPSLYAEVLQGGAVGLDSLRTVILGGEALPPKVARTHLTTLPEARLFNEYGPTETTVFSTAYRVEGVVPEPVPIGHPILRTQCCVLDRYQQLVPRGGFGELYIGGAGVAAGYANRPDLTAARFVPEPWSKSSTTVYRTGDRVRFDRENRLEFHGRLDQQVQVRGYRVELGEVETALRRLPGIAQAVVVASGEPDIQLHGYVVATDGQEPDPAQVRRDLRVELPEPLVPTTLTVIDRIPRAPSGKVDLTSLPKPDLATSEKEAEHWRVLPYTRTEQQIYDVIRAVLNRDSLSVHDDFFASGGTSIQAVRVLNGLHKAIGIKVPLHTFVGAPSVAGLAEALHREELLEEEPLVVVLKEGDGGPPFWIMHPVGGHVVFASRIAARWSDRHALYGIQAPGLDGRRPPVDSMDVLAPLYIDLIRERQPEGPYFLGGPSLGGLIAYEVAQQLTARGEKVELVAMLDCYAPGFPRPVGRVRKVFDHVQLLRQKSWTERLDYARIRVERWRDRREEEWKEYRIQEAGDDGAVYDTLLQVQYASERLSAAYEPQPYPGELHVLRALKTPVSPGYRFDDPARGWKPYAKGGVVTVDIDGAHHTMLDEPEVDQVARELERLFAQARSKATHRAGFKSPPSEPPRYGAA